MPICSKPTRIALLACMHCALAAVLGCCRRPSATEAPTSGDGRESASIARADAVPDDAPAHGAAQDHVAGAAAPTAPSPMDSNEPTLVRLPPVDNRDPDPLQRLGASLTVGDIVFPEQQRNPLVVEETDADIQADVRVSTDDEPPATPSSESADSDDADRSDDDGSMSEERDVVQFAAGAIEFEVPHRWVVTEVNAGREVRLFITPGELPADWPGGFVGAWITYHVRNATETPPPELDRWLQRRVVRSCGGRGRVRPEEAITVHGLPAVRQAFLLGQGAAAQHGFHLAVRPEWGVVDLHIRLPRSRLEAAHAELEHMVAGLKLQAPEIAPTSFQPVARDAAEAVGAWKALRGRLLLAGDGRVEVRYDGPRMRRLDFESGELITPRQRLTGRFGADGDLLQITWDDGSRLNYRWRLDRGELLLTDHQGRVSQLRRLLE